MQPIERYGVIALVFLLVTIVAVSFWGDGSEDGGPLARLFDDEPVAAAVADEHDPASAATVARRSMPADPPLSPPLRPAARDAQPRAQDAGALSPYAVGFGGSETSSPRHTRAARTRQRAVTSPVERPHTAAPAAAQPDARSARATRVAQRDESPAAPARADESRAASAKPPAAATTGTVTTRTEAARARTVLVRRGDTLSGLAQRELGSAGRWREIAALNGDLDPRRLYVGMRLALPSGDTEGVSPATTPAPRPRDRAPRPRTESPQPRTADRVVVVEPGDTLSEIAARELGSAKRWREIVAANPSIDPARLFVGARLKLPADAGPARSDARVAQAAPPTPRGSSTSSRRGGRVR